MVNGATTTSNCFMERSIKNANLRVVLSPTGSFTVYFSKIVASAIFNLICHIAVLLISIPLFHLYFPAESIAVFVCMMIPIEFASSGLGAFCCCLMKSEEGASSVLAMGIAILALVGGSFFSMERLGNMMRNASYFSPIRWLNQASFTVLFDHNYTAVMPVILISIAVFGAFLFGCAKSFHMEDYLC
jgi:ABC-2 type transport system permease protein